MKTLVDSYVQNAGESLHAIIISNTYCDYDDKQQPIWEDEENHLCKTSNTLGNIIIFQTNKKGKVKRIEIPNFFISEIASRMHDIKKAKTEPTTPEY